MGALNRVTILFIAHALPKTLQVDQVLRIEEKLTIVPGDKRPETAGSLGESAEVQLS